MVDTSVFIKEFSAFFPEQKEMLPWKFTQAIERVLTEKIATLGADYEIKDGVAIHKTAIIEPGTVMKGPIIISENCSVGGNAYLRNGVFLGKSVIIGPSCEIKASAVFSHTTIAHFNFVGDSLIGSYVNFEA